MADEKPRIYFRRGMWRADRRVAWAGRTFRADYAQAHSFRYLCVLLEQAQGVRHG